MNSLTMNGEFLPSCSVKLRAIIVYVKEIYFIINCTREKILLNKR